MFAFFSNQLKGANEIRNSIKGKLSSKKEEKDFERPLFEGGFLKNRASDGPSSKLLKDTGEKEFHQSLDKSLSNIYIDF